MAKKQTFVVGSSNPITESLSDAQLNQGWNQYEVLHSGTLDGVFNAISKQSQINADEITNALDVYSLTPDPDDNTQLKQVLTTMDNKINQVVSGGEIIGSFWFGKTTSGFTVPAPTIIGQTYIDFTTLDHYISNDGSTWTYNGTLTLPALQDAIVLVTSKFWDIPEQTNQYGGRAIYSLDLSQWVYYPTVIDLSGYVTQDTAQTISGAKDFTTSPTVPSVSVGDNSSKAVSSSFVQDVLLAIYPVGSVYIGTQSSCPMATVMPGTTWQLVSSGRALWTGTGSNGNTTIAAGLPNITGKFSADCLGASAIAHTGAFSTTPSVESQYYLAQGGGIMSQRKYDFNAASSNSIYGNSSTVQPPAYVVNVWRRTA